jgi:hypothetical protein
MPKKKPNMKIVQRRYKSELRKNAHGAMRHIYRMERNSEIRKELKDRVRREEAVKSTPTFNLIQVCAHGQQDAHAGRNTRSENPGTEWQKTFSSRAPKRRRRVE